MSKDRQEIQEQLDRARAGDRDAFAELFEPYRPLVTRIAIRLVGPDASDDVVVDTCVKGWQALPRFEGSEALGRWWCRIARNAALDEIRRRRRREDALPTQEPLVTLEEDGPTDPLAQVADPRAPSPAEFAERKDLAELIERALAKLGEDHRTTLLLREVDGLEYRQIAQATGVSIGTVMSRLFHARRRMRRLIEEEQAHETA